MSIRDVASSFEAVKIAMTQDKNGFILKLSLHPADAPEDILRDLVGQRYQVALVRLSDDGQPVASPDMERGAKIVMAAGALCADERFQRWLFVNGEIDIATEVATTEWLRSHCKISSRRELKTNKEAQALFNGVRDEFVADLRAGVA